MHKAVFSVKMYLIIVYKPIVDVANTVKPRTRMRSPHRWPTARGRSLRPTSLTPLCPLRPFYQSLSTVMHTGILEVWLERLLLNNIHRPYNSSDPQINIIKVVAGTIHYLFDLMAPWTLSGNPQSRNPTKKVSYFIFFNCDILFL